MKTSTEIRFEPRRILVPTDFSDTSRPALAAAGALAGRFGSRLAVVNVVERGQLNDPAAGATADAFLTARRLVHAKLKDFVAGELGETILPVRVVVHGAPFDEIARTGRAWEADLVVIATHGYTGLKHALLGSTAERVVRYASCPVLVVRSRKKRRGKLPFGSDVPRSILVPVDFSESSLAALNHALAWAQQYDAQLCLLHVTEPFHADMLVDTTEIQRIARQAAQQRLNKLTSSTKKIWPHTGHELRRGHPVGTITAMAERTNADLIVMGTHGRTGVKRALIGSVAERVVREAPCSVLVVRESGPV